MNNKLKIFSNYSDFELDYIKTFEDYVLWSNQDKIKLERLYIYPIISLVTIKVSDDITYVPVDNLIIGSEIEKLLKFFNHNGLSFKKSMDTYYNKLHSISLNKDFNQWINYSLKIVGNYND